MSENVKEATAADVVPKTMEETTQASAPKSVTSVDDDGKEQQHDRQDKCKFDKCGTVLGTAQALDMGPKVHHS